YARRRVRNEATLRDEIEEGAVARLFGCEQKHGCQGQLHLLDDEPGGGTLSRRVGDGKPGDCLRERRQPKKQSKPRPRPGSSSKIQSDDDHCRAVPST